MARKLNIPKAAQIRGIRKALANRKTPKQFIPGLKKRLAKLLATVAFVVLFLGSARAQTPVTLIPTQQTLATNVSCTGLAQNFTVTNRNQSQHWASIQMLGANTSAELQIFGIDFSGNVFPISGAAFAAGLPVVVTGTGYYPTVQVTVTCTGGSFTLSYSGGSAPFAVNDGAYLQSQIDKQIFFGASGSVNAATLFIPPFGSSIGTVVFDFRTSAVAGSTIQIACFGGATGAAAYETWTWTLANAIGIQKFRVPGASCDNVSLTYSSGGTSGLIDVDYLFDVPGSPNSLQNYTHITGTTATVVKAGPGVVHTVVVGTPAAGTISLFDLAPASCTATPSTSVVSVITATTTFPAAPEIYDVIFQSGICVKASAAMDITISSQ